jgi:hypothetical protein
MLGCDALVAAGAWLAEPVETRASRSRKRRAKADREDARWLRERLAEGNACAAGTGAAGSLLDRAGGREHDAWSPVTRRYVHAPSAMPRSATKSRQAWSRVACLPRRVLRVVEG